MRTIDLGVAKDRKWERIVEKVKTFSFEVVVTMMGPREMRMGSGEGSTMRNFIVCTVHLI